MKGPVPPVSCSASKKAGRAAAAITLASLLSLALCASTWAENREEAMKRNFAAAGMQLAEYFLLARIESLTVAQRPRMPLLRAHLRALEYVKSGAARPDTISFVAAFVDRPSPGDTIATYLFRADDGDYRAFWMETLHGGSVCTSPPGGWISWLEYKTRMQEWLLDCSPESLAVTCDCIVHGVTAALRMRPSPEVSNRCGAVIISVISASAGPLCPAAGDSVSVEGPCPPAVPGPRDGSSELNPEFTAGESVYLFLDRTGPGRYLPRGGLLSKYAISGGDATAARGTGWGAIRCSRRSAAELEALLENK